MFFTQLYQHFSCVKLKKKLKKIEKQRKSIINFLKIDNLVMYSTKETFCQCMLLANFQCSRGFSVLKPIFGFFLTLKINKQIAIKVYGHVSERKTKIFKFL